MSEAVFTESIVLLATALADLPAGFIANKVNNKPSLLVGALLHVVSIILLGIGSSLAVFVVSALLMGIGWGLYFWRG